MTTKYIYIVKACGGRWEDAWEHDVKAFLSEWQAEAHKKCLEIDKEEQMERIDSILDEFDGSWDSRHYNRCCRLSHEKYEISDVYYDVQKVELVE